MGLCGCNSVMFLLSSIITSLTKGGYVFGSVGLSVCLWKGGLQSLSASRSY